MKVTHTSPCPRCRDNGKDGRGDNLVHYIDGGFHCYSCAYHRSPTKPWLKVSKEETIDTKVLPPDFTREIPGDAWKWLLQYGLSYRYWHPFVGWSEKDSRLVFTVGQPIKFSIGRYIDIGIKESNKKWYVYGESHKTTHVVGDYLQSKRIVLVEDLISAHKVGQITSCIPLFGTKVFDACLPTLRHIGLPITIWLDKDQEGTVQKKAANLSLLTSLPVSYVFTDRDPKCLSLATIEKELGRS